MRSFYMKGINDVRMCCGYLLPSVSSGPVNSLCRTNSTRKSVYGTLVLVLLFRRTRPTYQDTHHSHIVVTHLERSANDFLDLEGRETMHVRSLRL